MHPGGPPPPKLGAGSPVLVGRGEDICKGRSEVHKVRVQVIVSAEETQGMLLPFSETGWLPWRV